MAPHPLDLDALTERVRVAVESNDRGRAAEAARRFESIRRQIVRSGDERPDVLLQHSRVMLGLVSSQLDVSGDVGAALGRLAEAEDLARRAGAVYMQAAIRGQRGLLWLRLGETDRALAAFDEGMELIGEAEPYDQARMLLNRGVLNTERGALTEARVDLERCLEIATAVQDTNMQSKAGHNLGYVDFLAGNIPRALAAIAEAAGVHGGDPHPVTLLDHARVLREAGLVSDADVLLRRTAELFEAQKLYQDLGETELARADCALAEGDALAALGFATSARRRFAKRKNLRWQRKAELVVLRAEREAADNAGPVARRRLLRLAERAAALSGLCRQEGRADLSREAALLATRCRLEAGEQPEAEDHMRVRPEDPLATRMLVRELRARQARARSERAAGLRETRAGLAELHTYQSSFGSLDLRTASAVHGVSLARLDLELALESGRPSDVFGSIERSRAVSSRLASVRPPSDEETARLLAELRQVEETMRALEGDPESLDALSKLQSRASTVQREIRERGWHLEGRRDSGPAVVSWGRVRQAAVDSGSAFVSYAQLRGRWLAVLVAGRRSQVVDLADVAEIEELVRRVRADLDALAMPRLPEQMRQVVAQALSAGLRRLDEALIGPLRVDGMPLVLSGSGVLVVLPWSLLPSRRGLPVVVTPTAGGWVDAQASLLHVPANPRVSVVAGPGLHRAQEEAGRVHRTWPGSSLLVEDGATTAAVRAALAEADVVHVAAHGTHRQDSPLFSSLRLADGPLYAYELDAQSRIAPFVALSACEAGLSTVRPGDEGLGLTSVLLHLGTRSVLAGVARVRDDVAADVMDRVQSAVAKGVDSARALALAQADCPEIPAAFVCFGAAWRA